ncbi:MAG: GIY-YIG nuclease family protein, partial [Ignavibacteriaceae bacterium]|nr:GIY-YIG nuclease family protein [Ignavibacteriaceae bacterium]
MTSNQEERIQRHNSGRERTTRAYRPFELIYSEEQATREEARKREKYFKSGAGKEFLK